MEQKQTKTEKLKELLAYTWIDDIDIPEDINEMDIDNFKEYYEQYITETEVVYYSNAMKFLSENDESLSKSLEIADNLGYEVKNLNSELLATLLTQELMRNDLYENEEDIENILTEDN